MKLSQPKSARSINNYRVLNLLRDHQGLSKAELSRMLNLNKVSTGEIVENLIKEGLIKEGEKLESVNGRRPTALELIKNSRFVLGVDIGPKNSMIALSDLKHNIVKFERIPTETNNSAEDFVVKLIKSCMRTMRLVPDGTLLGVAITISAIISADEKTMINCPFLPWKDIPFAEVFQKALGIPVAMCNSLSALVLAEKLNDDGLKHIFYVDWGERINAALVNGSKVFGGQEAFGHLKVASKSLCTCGQIGCLEAISSTWALCQSPEASLKDLWGAIDMKEPLEAMARALAIANEVCGFEKVIIGGQGSTIPEDALIKLKDLFEQFNHPYTTKAQLVRSRLGENANIIAALNFALDRFFFHSGMLSDMEGLI